MKPPLMSVKIMPYGRCCFLTSSISIFSSSACSTLCVASTTRLPWRATGGRPGEWRPWPLECGNPAIGLRPITKPTSLP